MKDATFKLLQLINEEKTLNEISKIMGLSNKQIFTRLSMLTQQGFNVDRKYYYNGDISYSVANPFYFCNNRTNKVILETPENIQKIRMLITSDTHLGNINDNIRAIDKMMEYCTKEGINIIINAGDFFEGIYPRNEKNIKTNDPFEQIKYGLRNYPYDRNILTFVCLGNHDATFWLENGIDIRTVLLNRRHDIIPVGYGSGIIKIADNKILLHHPIDRLDNYPLLSLPNCLVIKGHSHKFKVYDGGDRIILCAPSTSNVMNCPTPTPFPSIIDMELTLYKGSFQHEYFQHFLFINNEYIRVSEIEYSVVMKGHKKIKNKKSIIDLKPNMLPNPKKEVFSPDIDEEEFEEFFSIDEIKEENIESINISNDEITFETGQDNNKRKTQIEKFNMKYGNLDQKKKVLKKQ